MAVTPEDWANLRGNVRLQPVDQPNEAEIFKKIVKFASVFQSHVSTWRALIAESLTAPVRGVANLAEQLRHVDRADIKHMEDFESVQKSLSTNILETLEFEMEIITNTLAKLSKSLDSYKSSLVDLESSTQTLDFNSNLPIVIGNATQPALSTILQEGLTILHVFSESFETIKKCVKSLDYRNESKMETFVKSFDFDFDNRSIVKLQYLTQYLDKENLIL